MMYAFAKTEAVRSFREAWKRDPNCAICYWGEAWAWGSYLNGPMTARRFAAGVRGAAEGDRAQEPRAREGARVHRRAVGALRREVRRGEARRAGSRLRRGDAEAVRAISGRSRRGDALRRRAVPARAAARHARREQPDRAAAAPGARSRAARRTSSIRARVISTCTPPSRRRSPGKAEPCAEFLGNCDSRREPHQSHAVAHVEPDRPLGRLRARQHPGVALGSRRPRSARASRSIPSTTCTCSRLRRRWTARARSRFRPARTTRSCTNDTIYHVLTLVRFGRFDEIAAVTARPIGGGLRPACGTSRRATRGCDRATRPGATRVSRQGAEDGRRHRRPMFRRHPAQAASSASSAASSKARFCRAKATCQDAIEAFEQAVKLEDEIDYDEPEPLPFSARHWLGAALLEAKRARRRGTRVSRGPRRTIRTTAGRSSASNRRSPRRASPRPTSTRT